MLLEIAALICSRWLKRWSPKVLHSFAKAFSPGDQNGLNLVAAFPRCADTAVHKFPHGLPDGEQPRRPYPSPTPRPFWGNTLLTGLHLCLSDCQAYHLNIGVNLCPNTIIRWRVCRGHNRWTNDTQTAYERDNFSDAHDASASSSAGVTASTIALV